MPIPEKVIKQNVHGYIPKSKGVSLKALKEEIDTMIKYSGTALPPSKLGEFRNGYILALQRARKRLCAVEKEACKK